MYPDRVYTEVVYTEASLTQPMSTDEGADEKADDSHEEPHNDAAPSTPSYGEPSIRVRTISRQKRVGFLRALATT